MLQRTTTPYAPWTIVESNCKRYARAKVLETDSTFASGADTSAFANFLEAPAFQ
jgi:Polyphosphate kinase 2 (PPK2)